MNRRGFLIGAALVVAPAIIRTPGLLMPVKPAIIGPDDEFALLRPSIEITSLGILEDEIVMITGSVGGYDGRYRVGAGGFLVPA